MVTKWSQNRPRIGPKWVPNRFKNGYRSRNIEKMFPVTIDWSPAPLLSRVLTANLAPKRTRLGSKNEDFVWEVLEKSTLDRIHVDMLNLICQRTVRGTGYAGSFRISRGSGCPGGGFRGGKFKYKFRYLGLSLSFGCVI